jgi:hypothetical protein
LGHRLLLLLQVVAAGDVLLRGHVRATPCRCCLQRVAAGVNHLQLLLLLLLLGRRGLLLLWRLLGLLLLTAVKQVEHTQV